MRSGLPYLSHPLTESLAYFYLIIIFFCLLSSPPALITGSWAKCQWPGQRRAGTRAGCLAGGDAPRGLPALLSPVYPATPGHMCVSPPRSTPPSRPALSLASWPWAGVSLSASVCCSCPERAGLIYPRPASVSASPSPAELGRACIGPGRGVLKPEYSRVSFHIVYSGSRFLKRKELSFARPFAVHYVLGGLVGG